MQALSDVQSTMPKTSSLLAVVLPSFHFIPTRSQMHHQFLHQSKFKNI